MNKTQLLIGSLSNDLYRVANCRVNGSKESAIRFAKEAKRWAVPLQNQNVADHIKKIAKEISSANSKSISLKKAENYLMYSILLQNYVLHSLKSSS
jgi:hypothetical protein